MSITSTLESNNKYYHNVNYDVLNVIPTDAQTLLEVGCAAGPLARAYKEINPNCHYTGVELSDSAAQKASEILDKVIVGNVEKMD
ncbi:MAG: class I SAM-dependent methyltransferase, partial [Rickettsiales bacterium]|nr:class I SAM-dependent methyltransferase [Rickettsiales bacterium]